MRRAILQIMQGSDRLPEMDLIIAFMAVVETRSFAGAGRKLGRDPTVVSRRFQMLKSTLGVRLAERTTRRLVLTEAGRLYFERLRPALRDLQSAQRDVAALAEGQPQGLLRVALPTSFGRMWMSEILTDFLIGHPLVTAEVEYANRYVDLVAEGFDVAVRLGVLADSRLIARKLCDRRRLLCASPAYLARHGEPRQVEDLADHACLRFSSAAQPNVWSFSTQRGGMRFVPVSGPFTADDGEALAAAAVAGLGIINATDWLVGRDLASGALVPVLPDFPLVEDGAVYLVLPSRSGLPSKTRAFADWVAEAMKPPPWRIDGSHLAGT